MLPEPRNKTLAKVGSLQGIHLTTGSLGLGLCKSHTTPRLLVSKAWTQKHKIVQAVQLKVMKLDSVSKLASINEAYLTVGQMRFCIVLQQELDQFGFASTAGEHQWCPALK